MNKENSIMIDQYKRIQKAGLKILGRKYSVYKGVNTIGRNKTAIINVKNVNVSQHHAVIIILDDTQHFISDLNSSNGTYLCEMKLSPYKLYELPNDVQIKFGDTVASYFKVSNMDRTLCLETENVDMTQTMTQNFYGTTTQLMINDSVLNQSEMRNTSYKDLEDIHQAATQVVIYPSTVVDNFKVNSEPSTNCSVEILDNDIHEVETQIVDYQQASVLTTKTNVPEMTIQSNFSPKHKNHEQEEIDIHEMKTQVVNFSEVNNRESNDSPITPVSPVTKDIDEGECSTGCNVYKAKNDLKINNSFGQTPNKLNLSTVIEETVIEEAHVEEHQVEEVNETSNDSFNFLLIHKPIESQTTLCNEQIDLRDDRLSTFSDSQDVMVYRKRPARKLSSSEDLSQTNGNKVICNSDSNTNIIDKLNMEKNIEDLSAKINDSGSDTEIEDDLPLSKQSMKVNNFINSDSETDIEDNISHNNSLTPPQDIIKPRILSSKRALDSDSETDLEDNVEKELVLEAIIKDNSTTSEILNDTDCIPATQEVCNDIFMFKNSKLSKSNVQSQNASSEESFKLGLTELMTDSFENKTDNAQEEEQENINENEENIDIRKNHGSNNHSEKHEDLLKIDDENDKIKLSTSKEQKGEHNVLNKVSDELNNSNETSADISNDYLYIMPTQKLNKNLENEIPAPTTSKEIDLEQEIEEDIYMMSTQKLNNESQFKTPQKKYNFKKKVKKTPNTLSNSEDNEDDSSTTTQNEDIYLQATQKLNESSNNYENKINKDDEDIYFAPTQRIHIGMEESMSLAENVKSSHDTLKTQDLQDPEMDIALQPTQDLNLQANNLNKNEENLLMLATQKIHTNFEVGENDSDKISPHTSLSKTESVNMFDTSLKCTEEKDDDLYLAETQPTTSNLTDQVSISNICIDVPTTQTDLYLQETQILESAKNVISNKKSENPYFTPTQQINQDSIDGNSCKRIQGKKSKRENDYNTETLSQIQAFIQQPLTITTSKDSNKYVENSHHNSNKKEDEIHHAETLSQIERFVKEPFQNSNKQKIKSLPKKKCPINISNEATAGEASKIAKVFINEPSSSEMEKGVKGAEINEKSEQTNNLMGEEKVSDKYFQVPQQRNMRSLKRKSAIQSKSHISKEECDLLATEQGTNSGKSISVSKQQPVKGDVEKGFGEKSFALLEAKSKKTRKSQRLTDSVEIKVNVCKNRRSMATSAIPENSSNVKEIIPSTRKSRKRISTLNNNTSTIVPDNSENKLRCKRKFETANIKETKTDIESEKPSKIIKKNTKVDYREKEEEMDVSLPSTSKITKDSKISKISSDSHNFDLDNQNSNDSVLSTPSRRGRRKLQIDTVLTSPEKGKRKQKPKIVFTMLDSPLLETLIRQMGGSVVDNVESSTVLITEHVKRSQKLLAAIGQGKPICSPQWIHDSKKVNEFLDPWNFILLDKEAESKWDFSLKESLTRAKHEKLLGQYTFQLMVSTAADVLKGAIEACGGKCVPRYPAKHAEGFFVIVASPENRNKYLKIKKQHPQITVVEPEAIFDGVLRQDLRLGKHLLT